MSDFSRFSNYIDPEAEARVEKYTASLEAKTPEQIEATLPPTRAEVENDFRNGERITRNQDLGFQTALSAYAGFGTGSVAGIIGAVTIASAAPPGVIIGGAIAAAVAGAGVAAIIPKAIDDIKEWRARKEYLSNPDKVLDPIRKHP